MNIRNLQEALGTSTKISYDSCDDPKLYGKTAEIYLDGDGSYGPSWYVMFGSTPKQETRHKLKFMDLWQGDIAWKLDRLPTKTEANVIRKIAGLRKKKELSPEHRQKLIEGGRKFALANECTRAKSSRTAIISCTPLP
jgi:hypothetical protein